MDLSAYLARIGLAVAPPASAQGLAALQSAHRRSIGFENLDVLLGRAIRIDGEAVFDKLVRRGRGGYCFEQNRLFADALLALGFAVRPLLARVRLGQDWEAPVPRSHVLLLVEIAGEAWIADAGFGGALTPPLPLREGATGLTPDGARHRLRHIGAPGSLIGEWLLERAGPPAATDGRAGDASGWVAQYGFDLAQVCADDLEQVNHWTSTRAGTRFLTTQVASIVLDTGFAALTDTRLTLYRDGRSQRREIRGAQDLRETLAGTFRIDLPEADVARLPVFAG